MTDQKNQKGGKEKMVLKKTGGSIIIEKYQDNCPFCNRAIQGNGIEGAKQNLKMHMDYCSKNPSNIKENVKN